LVNKKPRIVTFSLIAVCIALMIFSTGNQNATARETLSVQIQASETTIPIYTIVQLSANASGGAGGYYYRWYANDVAIGNATSATCTFNVTQIGTYRVGCMIADATGVVPGTASAPEIYLYVTAKPMVAGQAPTTSPETSSGNQELTMIVAAVVVVSVIGAATIIIIKQRRLKQSNNP
jgi:hypothetical protein